ncbi:MAG TPA: GDSL-type esterase/lipase family protein [Phycisphaerae bacterium]|nr:GDSL-type esterase/lipase family protein [Phycisphaerae bacterium]
MMLTTYLLSALILPVAGTPSPPGAARVVVLLGDSTTLSHRSADGDKHPESVRAALHATNGFEDVVVVNSGKGSDTASDALGRVDADVAAHDPDVTVISFGLNDQSRRTPDEFEHDLRVLIEAIRARCRADVIVATSTPFDDRHARALKSPYTRPGSLDRHLEENYNARTRRVAESLGLPLCDQHRCFIEAVTAGRFKMTDLLGDDGVHLTPAGNRLMAANLVPFITGGLTDSKARGYPGLLPRPKEFEEAGQPLLLAKAGGTVTVRFRGDDAVVRTARQDLADHFARLGGSIKLVERNPAISIRITEEGVTNLTAKPIPPQGYGLIVRPDPDDRGPVITIIGSDLLGAFYGVQTLIQLLDSTPEGITVRQCRIVDWPTFTFRSFKGQCWWYRDNRMLARWMDRWKWNVFGPCYTDILQWREPPDAYRRMIADLCTIARNRGTTRIMQLGNPFVVKAEAIRATSEDDLRRLADLFELSLSGGSDVLMLCFDDFAYLPDEDKQQYGDLAAAHTSIINRFAERIRQAHPGARILFCPPPYWLPSKEEERQYLRKLSAGIPKDISIVWTGRHVTTVRQEAEHIQAYQELIGKDRQLFLWDNTLKMPPGWSNVFRMNAFLADCTDLATSAWPRLGDFTRGEAVINTYGPGEIYRVPLMTAADYLWNPQQYDPQDALRRALYWFDDNPRVGPLVYRWINGLHQRLYTLRERFLKAPSQEDLDQMRGLISQYKDLFARIETETKNVVLVGELRPYLRRHVDAMPIMTDVLAGHTTSSADSAEGKRLLDKAAEQLSRLSETLARRDSSLDEHALSMRVLEESNLKAIRALATRAASQTATAASDP